MTLSVYLYRWKIRTGMESSFENAWSFVTMELRENEGSLGSRLRRGSDGFFTVMRIGKVVRLEKA